MLAINSKNNLDDVIEVFDKHPDMLIKKKDIVALRVNWQDKATNLKEIANELNIGLSSMVFIDDNPAECDLVAQQLPEVDVVMVPKKTHMLPTLLATITGLDNIRITSEDSEKNKMYKSQAKRTQLKQTANSLADFLISLDMSAVIKNCDEFSVPRVAQLTQKTNQFNLTTKRYTESDILSMVESMNYSVFSVSVNDKFGSNGVVGVIILHRDGSTCVIDSFMLSCRVISRTVEQSMLAFIEDVALSKGLCSLIGIYLPTSKNSQVKDFYSKHGFSDVDGKRYCLKLKSYKQVKYSPYIKLNIDELLSQQVTKEILYEPMA